MNTFIEVPTNAKSIGGSKLVLGAGANDADYRVNSWINGKKVRCPFYIRWKNMLMRCYSAKFQKKCPSYIGCTVSLEWLTFSKFRSWMEQQDWQGNELDKDLLVQGNKFYGPTTCLFLPHSINSLINDNKANRGLWPVGVNFHKQSGDFQASCKINGKLKYIGLYSTPEEASAAYKAFKYKVIAEAALTQPEPIRSALLAYIILD